MRTFTLYVCPECDAVAVDVTASSHYCKEGCGMWIRTSVIDVAAWERLDEELQRLRFIHDAVVDKAMWGKP